MRNDNWTIGLAIFFVIASAVTLFIWIPSDIETGIIETYRRQVTIGDAMAPTIAAVGVLVTSLLMIAISFFQRRRSSVKHDDPQVGLDKQSLVFLLKFSIPICLGLVLMLYVGPFVVHLIDLLGGNLGGYRYQKATAPYKYLGFVTGGFTIVLGLTRLVEGRFIKISFIVSLLAVILLTILYDLPFDDLLLPPNGDIQ